MKLKNILSGVVFLIMMISCSMEDEVVLNDIDKEIQNNVEAYAYVDLNLVGKGSMTKAANSEDEAPIAEESSVNNCYLAIFNTDSKLLLNSFYYVNGTIKSVEGEEPIYALDSHFQMKVSKVENERPNLTFVAIANINYDNQSVDQGVSSLATLKACDTYDKLMAATIYENPTVLVKKGEISITKSQYETSSLVSEHDSYCTKVIIPVYQRSAAVELSSFIVRRTKSDGAYETLSTTDVKFNLYNVNLRTKVKTASDDIDSIEETVYNASDSDKRLYTYENMTDKKTYMKVSYTLNGNRETTRALYIKTPVNGQNVEEVLANHLYKLTVTVTNGTVNVGIKCYTKDWNYTNDADHNFEFIYKD